MQYEQGNQKMVITNESAYPVIQPMPVYDDPQFKRSRKTLLILNGIWLALYLINAIIVIVGLAIARNTENASQGIQITQYLIGTMLYGFGFYVVKKNNRTGLRVFTRLCIIYLIITGIVLIYFLILAAMMIASGSSGHLAGSVLGAHTIFFIGSFIASMNIILRSFKLAQLIPTS